MVSVRRATAVDEAPFLRFELAVTPGDGPVELRLTGPPGTREFLATWLEPARSERKGQ
jgi:hypothetical protein